MLLDPLSLACLCMHTYKSDIDVIPFRKILATGLTNLVSQPQLYCSSLVRCSRRGVVRVPLQPDFRLLLQTFLFLILTSECCGEDVIESFPSDPHSQYPLLARLGGPATAVHHPKEIGLDP